MKSNEQRSEPGQKPLKPAANAPAQSLAAQSNALAMGSAETVADRTAMGAAEELANLLDQYLADLEAGRSPDRAALLARHPELRVQLEEALAGLDFIHGARGAAGKVAPAAQLGDFRLVREVGRGGMGVVYEAEQLSLKRRVALKVLSAGAALDEVAMQRFQREAETVATLHHTNIVPIFAVGCEGGVRYYAMQFVEGRNLAEVAGLTREAKRTPIAYADVANWGLQAAEAIAHAHERGVIHRDIKPSNLILDRDGRVWLTDFGLARRLEDATLSLTGALLGTPRYMSPEQAGAATNPIDHRTDIYSLGATLYELATGRPIFDATTPQAVLNQILTRDPVPPRRIVPDLPRDLETIIIKCLVKDPAQRYATARALAEDLRAFLENRSIKARRVGLPVRALRWARKHRRSTTVAGISAAASVVVLALTVWGIRGYWEKHQAKLSLSTSEPLLQAEILRPQGQETAKQPFSLPTRQPVGVAPGNYEVKLSAPGALSETHLLALEARQEAGFDVSLQNRSLVKDIPIDGGRVELLQLNGPADLIVLRGWDLQRVDAASGNIVWATNLNPHELKELFGKEAEKAAWLQTLEQLLKPAPDLDGDQVGDLVWSSAEAAAVMARSGKTGGLLWFHPGYPPEPESNPGQTVIHRNLDAGGPAVADLDGDGTPDLIAIMTSRSRRWVQAISGKSGQRLWARWIDDAWLKFPTWTNTEIVPSPVVVKVGDRLLVCLAAGTQLVLLNATDGSVLHQQDLHSVTLQPPQVADLDGDDQPDLVILGERNAQQRVVIAYSPQARSELWQKAVGALFEPYQSVTKRLGWPAVADLDHDGKSEILLPAGSFQQGPASYLHRDHWHGVQVLSGQTGLPLWEHTLARGITPSIMEPVQHFTVGKDLDADGYDELFVASIYRRSFDPGDTFVFVDALSGKDGRALWSWSTPKTDLQDKVSPIVVWEVPGASPLLALWCLRGPNQSDTAYVLDAATGQLRHTLPGAFQLETADCDGDAIPDLAFRTSASPDLPTAFARQHVIRGTVPRTWSRLVDARRLNAVAPDVDQDGVDDMLLTDPPEMLSGRTGARLWKSELPAGVAVMLSAPAGDLDGDGLTDILAFQEKTTIANGSIPLLSAISSRTGRLVWDAEIKSRSHGQLLFAAAAHLHTNGAPSVVVAVELDITRQEDPMIIPQRSNQVWLVVVDGRNGAERWRQPLTQGYEGSSRMEPLSAVIEDLDGDGSREVLMGALNQTNAWELRAHQGTDGAVLWTHPFPTVYDNLFNVFRKSPVPQVADLDANGVNEVIVGHSLRRAVPTTNFLGYDSRVIVLDARTGQPRWSHLWHDSSDHHRVNPMLVRSGRNGQTGICVVEGRMHTAQLVWLDPNGSLTERRKVPFARWPAQLQVADVDGDDADEILYITNDDKIVAASGQNGIVRWEARGDDLHRVIPGGPNRPATVVVSRYQEFYGLSGQNGEPLWVTQKSGQRFGVPFWLRDGDRLAPLLVAPGPWSREAQTTGTIVSYGVKLLPAGVPFNLAPATGLGGSTTNRPFLTHTAPKDIRLARLLPWSLSKPGFAPQHGGFLRELTITESVNGLFLLLGLMLARVVWRRWSWRAGLPLLIGVLVVIAWLAESSRPPHLPRSSLVVVLTRSLLMIPLACYIGCVGQALVRGDARALGRIAALTTGLAVLGGTIWFAADRRNLLPGEYFLWSGWYFTLVTGAYLTGIVAGVLWCFGRVRAWLVCRRHPRAGHPTPRAASV